jgi:hypothetical protein
LNVPLRWLAAAIAGIAVSVTAQTRPPLDLRLKPVTQGAVTAIVTVDAAATNLPAPGAQSPGSPSDLSPGAPVGAVAVLPLGRGSDNTWRFGAAGTSEMQPYLDKVSQEVVVVMDDGERRTFRPRDASRFHVGQRVSVSAGELVPASTRKDGG